MPSLLKTEALAVCQAAATQLPPTMSRGTTATGATELQLGPMDTMPPLPILQCTLQTRMVPMRAMAVTMEEAMETLMDVRKAVTTPLEEVK